MLKMLKRQMVANKIGQIWLQIVGDTDLITFLGHNDVKSSEAGISTEK